MSPVAVDAVALELIDRPMVFTQRQLLSPGKFIDYARNVGIGLQDDDLAALHRHGILAPLYVIRRPAWNVRLIAREVRTDVLIETRWLTPTDKWGLEEDRALGLVSSGSSRDFRPRSADNIPGAHERRRENLYSHYQALDLDEIAPLLTVLRPRRRKLSDWERLFLERAQQTFEHRQRRTVLLSALENHYLTRITRHTAAPAMHGGLEAWEELDRHFDPAEVLVWSGWTAEAVRETARSILLSAMSDPLLPWLPLIRQMAPSRWQDLRSAPRLAIEKRIAAEMLLRFYEDLVARHLAPALHIPTGRGRHEWQERLGREPPDIDRTLMDFGLSPHPAVILALEGETEMTIVPRVLEELGIPIRRSLIELVLMGTETRDHTLLARFIALPSLGDARGGMASFLRPPTRYFIAVDGDRRFATQAMREAEHDKWVDALYDQLPAAYQSTESRSELNGLVVVEAWADGLDYERAHFTDLEIALALDRGGFVPASLSVAAVQTRLEGLRAVRAPLDDLWKRWPSHPSKPDLADLLWPVLRRRIRSKRSRRGLDTIPMCRVVLHACDLAYGTPRRNVVMRVGP